MKTEWSIHAEFLVLLVTLLGGFYLLDGKIERQGNRTDRLYEMFCDLQRQTKDELKEFHGRVCVVEERGKK